MSSWPNKEGNFIGYIRHPMTLNKTLLGRQTKFLLYEYSILRTTFESAAWKCEILGKWQLGETKVQSTTRKTGRLAKLEQSFEPPNLLEDL